MILADAAIIVSGHTFYQPVQPPHKIQVMAWRGERHQAPENTRAALERCIEDGLEWAGIDICTTKDGEHVVTSEASVADATGRLRRVSEENLADLKSIDIGWRFAPRFRSERILTLSDALSVCKSRLNLRLEYHGNDPGLLAKEIANAGMENQVVIFADLQTLTKLNLDAKGKLALMARWQPSLVGVEWAVSNHLAAVEVEPAHLTNPACKEFRAAGIKVLANLVGHDQPPDWNAALDSGVDWLLTDLPEEVMAQALWRTLPKRPVEVSFHRGANHYAPENTVPAFAKAVRMGADYVEFDVRTLSDASYFLLHDSRLDRTTDGSGPIDRLDAGAVRKLSAGIKFGQEFSEVRIPSLDEFLQEFTPKVGLYFDAKVIAPAALAGVLEKYQATERTVVYQSPKFLQELKAINPKIRGLAPLGHPEDLPKLISELKPYGVDADWGILSKELIERCHAAGIRVFSDSMGTHERIEDYLRAIDWGIDVIQTDRPLRVYRAIELRASQTNSTVPINP